MPSDDDEPRELGRVTTADGSTAYVLLADGTWRTPDEGATELLNIGFNLDAYSPAHGRPGAWQLARVAEIVGGTVEMPESQPMPPGTVY
jgi:hypothetical protein